MGWRAALWRVRYNMDRVKILIADDHALVRAGLKEVLADEDTLEIIGEASDGNEAVRKARALNPDVVLMDLNMPNCDGVEATRRIYAEMPDTNVLVLTVSEKDVDLFNAIKAGARGYLLKDEAPDQIIHAVHYVARGGTIVSPAMAATLLNEFKVQQPRAAGGVHSALSKREREVLVLVAQGGNNKGIASDLFISENTVKTHLSRILEKLHLANRSQAVAYAVRTGLDRDDSQTNH